MTRTHRSYGAAALIAALLSMPPASSARPAPVPPRPELRLAPAETMNHTGLWLDGAAVIDEDMVVLVGTKWDGRDEPPLPLEPHDPNGMIVSLAKKASRPFTNGHTSRIHSVSVSRGRVATASDDRDPVLRVWDVKAATTVAEVKIEEGPANPRPKHYGVGCFHTSDRVAVGAGERVLVLDPAKPDDRAELTFPAGVRGYVSHPIAVSPNDAWVASTSGGRELAAWEVASRKATVVSLIPEGVDDPEQWFAHGVTFGSTGELIAWRGGSIEVAEKKAEADVPADRRAVVRFDRPSGKLVPLGMGHTGHTFYCAIDPTGTWLATVGFSRRDNPRPDGDNTVGELRVYHLPTKFLAFREQVGELSLSWVAFTPSGKRIVASTISGRVMWWDVQVR